MGTNDLTRFPGGTQDKGLNIYEPDIGNDITWDEDTVNMSGGLRRGVGPRNGTAPLAGHADTETPSGTNCNGLTKSEGSSGVGLINRELIFGVVPVNFAVAAGAWPKANAQFYVYLVGLDDSSNVCLDACISATFSTPKYNQYSDIRGGLAESSYREESPLSRFHKTELLNLTTTADAAEMKTVMRAVPGQYWLPHAHISVAGKRIPYQWLLCYSEANSADATTAPNIDHIWSIVVSGKPNIYLGSPSEMITREGKDNNERRVSFYCLLESLYKLDIQYILTITDAKTTARPDYDSGIVYSGLTGANKLGASTAYSTIAGVLINDPGLYTNSKHEAILIAGEKPIAIVYQDWLRALNGLMPRFVDLSSPGFLPRPGISSSSFDGFNSVPSAFVNYGYLKTVSGPGVIAGNSNYDFGFSYYNKLLDYETNVAYGTTITTAGTVDQFTRINIGDLGAAYNSIWQQFQDVANAIVIPWEYSETTVKTGAENPRAMHLNDYEIRFYYRLSGIGEWLPGGNYDAAKFWFYYGWPSADTHKGPVICEGPSGALPGGQPNGFIDYSPLPKQRYICTLAYNHRVFWWSDKTMHFSLQNNIFAYPTRNITSVQDGVWRGGIVHARTGQIEQQARLVVFGSTATLTSRFTGNKNTQSVRVSADTIGQFEVDGSDFDMEYLSDATAWSYRAAVIAEGILYWWGAQGVYADEGDGVSRPSKISQILEPDIFTWVDTGRISEVHAIYNKTTKEIVWFYPPKVTDSSFPTHGLVYNTVSEEFYPMKFRCQVDASQNIKLENDSTPDDIDGMRTLLHCRASAAATISRTFFFDELVKAGDQYPTGELVVKQISTPTAGQRRLTFASGHVSVASVAVGDYIAIERAKGYAAELTLADDMVAKVTAVNNASHYIDILLPTGASLDGAITLTQPGYFPVYHRAKAGAGLHGIAYTLQTNYWLPTTLADSWHWLYMHMLFRYRPDPAPHGTEITFEHRTLRSPDYVSATITLSDNSDGHCQIHHPMTNGDGSAEGQALKWRFTGFHIGSSWTLEYLEAHCIGEDGFTLKQFEG